MQEILDSPRRPIELVQDEDDLRTQLAGEEHELYQYLRIMTVTPQNKDECLAALKEMYAAITKTETKLTKLKDKM